MKRIPVGKGMFALVDDLDYPALSKKIWSVRESGTLNKLFYACRMTALKHGEVGGRGKTKRVYMHQEILKPGLGKKIDHVDCNGLNNQRTNLRVCSHSNNCQHARPRLDNTCGRKGVSLYRDGKRYRARIWIGRELSLGVHATIESAALAYDNAARKHFGEYAKTNF